MGIIELYKETGNIAEVARRMKTNATKIRRFLIKEGISLKGNTYRKYKLDESFFDEINTFEKAYILGFMLSDGWITKSYFGLQLAIQDSEILYKIKDILKWEGPLYEKKEKTNKIKGINYQVQAQKQLFVSSVKIVKSLKKYGFDNNKTYTAVFPNVNKSFNSHLIRGIFDGDGSVKIGGKNKEYVDISGNQHILNSINIILHEELGLNLNKLYKPKDSNVYRLSYHGTNVVKKLYEYLYKDSEDLFIFRKHQKFVEHYGNV